MNYNNYLVVCYDSFQKWNDVFKAKLTFVNEILEVGEWAEYLEEHTGIDALLTDLAPIWDDIGSEIYPISYNGLNAICAAELRTLPSFVYTPYTPETLVSACYRAGCNAVMSSYTHPIEDFRKVVVEGTRDPELIWIDQYPSQDFNNYLKMMTDERLGVLSDIDLKIFNLLVTRETYDEIAKESGYKIGTLRNKVTNILRTCEFKNRTQAVIYALRIGVQGD